MRDTELVKVARSVSLGSMRTRLIVHLVKSQDLVFGLRYG